MTIKNCMLQTFVDIYEDVKKHINNGKVTDSEGYFNIYNQCTGLYFATLYTEKNDINPYYKNEETLKYAVECWDYYCTCVNEKGQTSIITFDHFWEDGIEEWNTLHLLNSAYMLRDYIPEEKFIKFRDTAYKSSEYILEETRKFHSSEVYADEAKHNDVRNHYVWYITLCYRYAMLTDNKAVMNEMTEYMEEIADFMLPFGTWLEGNSLVVNYAHTTYGALCQFLSYSNNKSKKVHDAAVKVTRYLLNCYYDNFTVINCIDSRNHYVDLSELAQFSSAVFDCKDGINYVSRHALNIKAHPQRMIEKQQSLGFFCLSYLNTEDREIDVGEYDNETVYLDKLDKPIAEYSKELLNTIIYKEKGFTVPVCLLVAKTFGNRWILERQNLISIYHKKEGLIMGGGHSISTPELSTFNVLTMGEMCYLHSGGKILDDKHFEVYYNNVKCKIEITCITEKTIKIKYTVCDLCDTGKVYVNIPVCTDNNEITVNGRNWDLSDMSCKAEEVKANSKILRGGADISLDKESVIIYPVCAFNPYITKQKKERELANVVIRCPLDYTDNSVELTVNINE